MKFECEGRRREDERKIFHVASVDLFFFHFVVSMGSSRLKTVYHSIGSE